MEGRVALAEKNTLESLRRDSSEIDKARLLAVSAPHASGWLQALPSKAMDQRFRHAEFVAAAQLWLGVPQSGSDAWCPKCDQVLDCKGFHCFACMAGGDATATHNSLRDHTFKVCMAAGLHPEREPEGLLPDDPRRRPGDLHFSTWQGGGAVAFDFAITSPLQMAEVAAAAQRQLAAATAYEERKRSDRATAEKCAAHGIQLIPMVAESLGGWGLEAQRAYKFIAQAQAAKSGLSMGVCFSRLYEGLSSKLMRANARSVLARVQVAGTDFAEVPAGSAVERADAVLRATAQ